MTSAQSRGRTWARAALVAGLVVAADQGTKHLIVAHLRLGDENPVFPAVTLVHAQNRGVAFSAFEGRTDLVTLIIVAAVLGLLVHFARHLDTPLIWLPTGLLAGGAIGNIVDRAHQGYVTDFIKLPAWPAFNLADTAITVGVLVLLYVIEGERSSDGADADHGRA